ncbi:hypothetical protein H0O43_04980 [Escherichia coli]|nr:hypothetical protein [Escherichia coli]
MKKNDKILHY